jgi:hypothetical protein
MAVATLANDAQLMTRFRRAGVLLIVALLLFMLVATLVLDPAA